MLCDTSSMRSPGGEAGEQWKPPVIHSLPRSGPPSLAREGRSTRAEARKYGFVQRREARRGNVDRSSLSRRALTTGVFSGNK